MTEKDELVQAKDRELAQQLRQLRQQVRNLFKFPEQGDMCFTFINIGRG